MLRRLERTLTNIQESGIFKKLAFPALLLALCIAAYGILIPSLGFYWDDYPISWISKTMGAAGLARYFSTNRPVWGMIYALTSAVLGNTPLTWQIAALLLRWGTGLSLWWLLRLTWPKRTAFAAWATALFVLYPGFSEQNISYVFGHFFIVLNLFLLSLCFNLLAIRRPGRFWLWMALAWAASAVNLFSMEYFFLLDLLRPALIWIVVGETAPGGAWRRLERTLKLWLPFLALLLGVMAWRTFIFGYGLYQPTFTARLKSEPLNAIGGLIATAAGDIWRVTAGAWGNAIVLIGSDRGAGRGFPRYWLLIPAAALGAGIILVMLREKDEQAAESRYAWLWQPLLAGTLGLAVAGGPFWLTDLPVRLGFPYDRFTLPFSLGASLVFAALVQLIPLPRWGQVIPLAMALGIAVGAHYHNQVFYARDWEWQTKFFQELLWRAPDLQPGTILLLNELPMHYTDNSLSAPLNWIYDPANDPAHMNYIFFYPTLRAQNQPWMQDLQKGVAVTHDYLATTFYGSSSQVVSIYFSPAGCLRVLDPDVDMRSWIAPESLRPYQALSSDTPILASPAPGKPAPHLPDGVIGSLDSPDWCYYFEKADLARQEKDWQQVAHLADEALAQKEAHHYQTERLTFIEGYAHVGNWQRAVEETREAVKATNPALMGSSMCLLWERIGQETETSASQQAALNTVRSENECP